MPCELPSTVDIPSLPSHAVSPHTQAIQQVQRHVASGCNAPYPEAAKGGGGVRWAESRQQGGRGLAYHTPHSLARSPSMACVDLTLVLKSSLSPSLIHRHPSQAALSGGWAGPTGGKRRRQCLRPVVRVRYGGSSSSNTCRCPCVAWRKVAGQGRSRGNFPGGAPCQRHLLQPRPAACLLQPRWRSWRRRCWEWQQWVWYQRQRWRRQ